MVMDKLGNALKDSIKKVVGKVFFDDKALNELIKDIQRALLHADVNVKLVFELTNKIKERAKEKVPKGVEKKAHVANIVYEELTDFLGKENKPIEIKYKPTKMMFVGLFGNGKTTTIGKLANYYTKRGKKVAAIGLDVHRPAAMKQLKQVLDPINVKCYIDEKEKNAKKIWKNNENELMHYDVVLIDTSGRDALSEDLVNEIEDLNKTIKPHEKLLVMNADLGQTALKQAEQFHKSCGISGVVVTKMDGSARAGGALSACAHAGVPIKFVGVGEKVNDIEDFNPKGFVSRLLGMGDLEALLEKAKVELDPERAEGLSKKIMKGDFDLDDLAEQLRAMKSMGSMNKILEMIPGFSGKIPKDLMNVQEDKLKKWEHIMKSMTKEERKNPDILFDRKRIERVAKGAGVTATEVRELLKQYRQTKKMMKMMKGNKMDKVMKRFKLPGM